MSSSRNQFVNRALHHEDVRLTDALARLVRLDRHAVLRVIQEMPLTVNDILATPSTAFEPPVADRGDIDVSNPPRA